MSNEINETMELETTMEPVEVYEGTAEEVESKSGSGLGLAALVVGGIAIVGGLAYKGIKKLKNKDADKPKKQKTKLKLVRVPVESDEDLVDEDLVEDVELAEDETEK